MGKTIERIALERGHEIGFIADSKHPVSPLDLNQADVVIEFTQPHLAVGHMKLCLANQTPIVVGTTAWHEDLPKIEDLVKENNGTLLHASNFSIGVNILFQLNERMAQIMSDQPDYKLSIEEIHHVQKLDAPSGTAVSLAEGILKHHSSYSNWTKIEGNTELSNHSIPIKAIREPDVPGTHHIEYSSTVDQITLSHIAHNRDGFALGAVIAAEFLKGKKGLFTMRDVLKF